MRALSAFADHCSRTSLTNRPTVFVQFIDVWNVPQGEIGIADPTDIGHTCFAVLTPWIMIPTIGEAWLVVDRVDSLEVTHLHVNARGIFDPHWSVEYGMDDNGGLVFGWETPSASPEDMAPAIRAAKTARMHGRFFEFEYDLQSVIPVVQGMLR